MIDISVIIPAYNSSKTILRCLNSLEQNSFSNYEIIVIDDYSSDETASIVRDFILQGNDNVVLLNNSKNLGPSYSRKIGIEKAKGKSLAFVDSDDYVEPHFLDLLCEARLNKNAQIIIYDYFVVKRNGKKKRHNVLPDLKNYSKDSRLVLSVDSFWTCLIDKELFKEVDFPNIRNGEDMAVIPQLLAKANSIEYLPEAIYNYMYYPNSLSNAYSETKLNSLVESFNTIDSRLGALYPKEIEFLGIRNLIYGGMLAIFKHELNKTLANKVLNDFELKYKEWDKSQYISILPFYKKRFVNNVKKRRWLIVRFLSMLHSILLG